MRGTAGTAAPLPENPNASESIAEAQLPDAHESGLRRDSAKALRVDGVRVDAVEFGGVREVEELEADLAGLVAGKSGGLRQHEIHVLAELVAGISDRPRGVAVLPCSRVRK